MKSKYWSEVGERLKSLGKTVFDMATPVAVDIAITKAVEKTCSIVEDKLKKMYLRTVRNSGISFTVNLIGVLILVFKPFGEEISRYVTYGFFSSAFVFWLVRTILFFKNYGKTTYDVSTTVLYEKSLYKGVEKYILNNFPVISLGYAGVSIASQYVPSLKEVPRISELVKYIVKTFWKRLALFAGIMATYTVTVFWVIKPILVRRFY